MELIGNYNHFPNADKSIIPLIEGEDRFEFALAIALDSAYGLAKQVNLKESNYENLIVDPLFIKDNKHQLQFLIGLIVDIIHKDVIFFQRDDSKTKLTKYIEMLVKNPEKDIGRRNFFHLAFLSGIINYCF